MSKVIIAGIYGVNLKFAKLLNTKTNASSKGTPVSGVSSFESGFTWTQFDQDSKKGEVFQSFFLENSGKE